MKSIIFILATSIFTLTGCGGDTAVSASSPSNGYVTPAKLSAVPSQ